MLDHLVVATRSLAEGVPWLSERLGADPTGGARHDRFATHNALWPLDSGAYLELIAVDPDASSPGHPRWFGLDRDAVRRAIDDRPRLIHWVARTRSLRPAWESEHGAALRLTRDHLAWTVTVPSDGSLPGDGTGVWPTLIAWDGAHPRDGLGDAGLVLERLVLSTPRPDPLRARLLEVAGVGTFGTRIVTATGPAALRAELRRDDGTSVVLG